MKLINDSGYSKERIEQEFKDTFIDDGGILRWTINAQIPFDDMLADFRTLDLIDENVQLASNLLREKETDDFWKGYFAKNESNQ